jgi:hypothetical protein
MTEETRERLHHLVDRAANPDRTWRERIGTLAEITVACRDEQQRIIEGSYIESRKAIKRAYGVEE